MGFFFGETMTQETAQVKIDTTQIDQLLRQLQARIQDPTPVLAEIGEILLVSIQRNFEAGGRPKAWARLAKSTIAQRVKVKKWPGKILQRSGSYGLLGSVNKRVGKDFVSVGANKVYATTHQFGARKGQFGKHQVTIPAHKRRIQKATKKGAKYATKTRIGMVKAHTRTMTIPWGNIPARPFLLIQDADMVDIKETINDFMVKS